MPVLPEAVREAWENHEGPAIFATVSDTGIPNAIYVTCLRLFNEDTFVVADNYFAKTRANISNGGNASLLFITSDRKSYQVKGTIEYQEQGEYRDFIRDCLEPKYPVVAAAVFHVTEVYKGADKLV